MLTNVMHCAKSICIQSFSAYISVFSPNAGIYGPETIDLYDVHGSAYNPIPCTM